MFRRSSRTLRTRFRIGSNASPRFQWKSLARNRMFACTSWEALQASSSLRHLLTCCASFNSGLATTTLPHSCFAGARHVWGAKNKANANNPAFPQRTWTSPRPGKTASIVPVLPCSCRQIACRLLVPQPLNPATKDKISMFCLVASEQVFGVHDVTSVYHKPLLLRSQGIRSSSVNGSN